MYTRFLISFTISIIGFLVADITFAQYDYYDPYSNSNIDYFPTNPLNTTPSKKIDSGGTGGSTSGSTSGGTTSGGITSTPVPCANKPKMNPQNTRSVEVRDKSGKVFYLSPPKEELAGIRAYPETSQKIFKIISGVSGMQIDEKEIGLITVDNKCYPKYGYVQNDSAVTVPQTSLSPLPSSSTQQTESATVPENATAVNLDVATGEVFNAKTGLPINDARYDKVARKIYYRNTYSSFGKVLTDTTGYVNIDSRGVENTIVAPKTTPLPSIQKISPLPSIQIKHVPKSNYNALATDSPKTPVVKTPDPTVSPDKQLPSSGKIVISLIEGGTGAISVRSHDSGEWTEGKIGMVLGQGYEVLANSGGSVSLLFADGSKVRLEPMGQIKISTYVTKGDIVQTEILLRAGHVTVEVNKEQTVQNNFTIRSSTHVAFIGGTKFSVKYNKDTKESMVSVDEGSVHVVAKNPWYLFWKKPAAVEVATGQKATISKKRDIKVENTVR